MFHFIFMLTQNDKTVSDALDVYRRIRKSNLRYVGFKDIGLPITELKALNAEMQADGKITMLEVVSATREAEINSIKAGIEIGVNYLLGGRHAADAVALLKDTGIQYFPFAGHTVGHPTKLTGTIEEIVEDAKRLAAIPGVHGLDLLAYRFDGDVPELARRVVDAVNIPVIAAGSIADYARIHALEQAGMWGFTVGSAIFEELFPTDTIKAQIDSIVELGTLNA